MKLNFIVFFLAFFTLSASFAQWNFERKIVAPDRQNGDGFGLHGADIYGDYAVVGAPNEDTYGTNAGAAYIYWYDPALCDWVVTDTIYAESAVGVIDATANDEFGASVSIQDQTVVIGAYRKDVAGDEWAGATYIYEINPSHQAVFQQKLLPIDDLSNPDSEPFAIYGFVVEIRDDIILVGAHWEDEDQFGANPVADCGAVYVYRNIAGTYVHEQKITLDAASGMRGLLDHFGYSIAYDSGLIIIGCIHDDEDENELNFQENAGSVYVYRQATGGWQLIQKLAAPAADRNPFDNYGGDLSFYEDHLVVGAPFEETDAAGLNPINLAGAVYTYHLDAGTFVYDDKLVPANRNTWDVFGIFLDHWDDKMVVSAYWEDEDELDLNTLNDPGSVYMYERTANTWNFTEKLVAPDRADNDFFGFSVAMHENRMIATAPYEDEDDIPPYTGGTLADPGSAYIWGPDNYTAAVFNAFTTPNPGGFNLCSNALTGIQIDLDGMLNDANYWEWYEDTCGTVPIGTGTSITVNPTVTTTYCVQPQACFPDDSCYCVTVNVNDAPIITFPPIPDVDICTTDSIQILATSDSGVCTFIGPGIIDPVDGWFDPVAAGGVGTYIITVSCTHNGCTSAQIQTVTVVDNDFWHQTTFNSEWRDLANDVVTDSDGNVYVTGQFIDETNFFGGSYMDVNANAMTGSVVSHSFVAKYDDCGNLEWVGYTEASAAGGNSWGSSLVLDEYNGLVYVAGTFENEITFNGGQGTFGGGGQETDVSVAGGTQAYVACFKMDFGAIVYQDVIELGVYTNAKAIDINETTQAIYVAGDYRDPGTPTMRRVWARRYAPTAFSIGPFEWGIKGDGAENQFVWDIDFNENDGSNGSLWMIGEFRGELTLLPGTTTSVNTGVGTTDAWVAKYEDSAPGPFGPTQVFQQQGQATNGRMTGRGISVDKVSGNAFVTGTYRGWITDIFDFGHPLPFLPPLGQTWSYLAAFDPGGNSAWSQSRLGLTTSSGRRVIGTDVTYKNGSVYFTGNYTGGGLLWFWNGPFTGYFGGGVSPGGDNHVYVVEYNAVSGVGNWVNVTTDCNTSNPYDSNHESRGITTDDNGNGFVVGSYLGCMSYLSGIPSSGDLISSFVSPISTNAYTMRMDLSNGDFKAPVNDGSFTSLEELAQQYQPQLVVYPNPAENHTTIRLENFNEDLNYQMKMTAIDGKIVRSGELEKGQLEVNILDFAPGVYIIMIDDGENTYRTKFVKS